MYSMALVLKVVLGWDINSASGSLPSPCVYVGLGACSLPIFNEVLQFVLIWLGALLNFHHRADRGRRLERNGGPHHHNFPTQDFTHRGAPWFSQR